MSEDRRGLLLADKPKGITSFAVVAELRRRLGARRVGHGGTLDPLATGLLPILIGEGTKLTPYVMGLDKMYQAVVRLGTATDTYDSEGRVLFEADPSRVTEQEVETALRRFVGHIRQRPPAFSAIKRAGTPLYQLARAAAPGEVEAPEREIVVHALDLVAFEPPDLTLVIRCGKGTYVRSIAHDLGEALGVHGQIGRAHV